MQEQEQKLSPIKQRILQFVESLNISKRDFYGRVGISRGTLESKTGITEDVMAKFIATYPEVNIEWLISGIGQMLNTEEHVSIAEPAADTKDSIPLVSATAIGGFGNFEFSIQATDVKGRYVVPKFQDKKIDFMIEVTGSSMYPKYNSGDIVACRIIRESQFIQWNKVHVVATREQGILVKRLKPSQKKGCILAVSDNKSYDPFEIPLEEIEGLALVVGVIRLE